MFYKRFKSSKLSRRIIYRFLFIEAVLFLLVLVLLLFVLLPALRNSTTGKCEYIVKSFANQFDSELNNLDTLNNVLCSSDTLKSMFHEYISSGKSVGFNAKLNILLNTYTSNDKHCRSIIIETIDDGRRLSSITRLSDADNNIMNAEGYQLLIAGEKTTWVSPVYFSMNNGTPRFSIAYCKNEMLEGTPVVVALFADVTNYFSDIRDLQSQYFDDVALYDTFGNLLYNSNHSISDSLINKVDDFPNYVSMLSQKSAGYYSLAYGNMHLSTVIGYTSAETLYKDFFSYFLTTLLFFIILFVSTIVIMLPLITKQLAPLHSLYESMNAINNGNLGARSQIKTKDEIGDLSQIFNIMIDTIEENTDNLLKKEKEKNWMRFSLIVSQIDPHFIFNTMNIITSLANHGKNEDIVKINNALISLLRDRLRISPTEIFDTVNHEINITKEYITIVQYRTQMNVVFDWILDESILDFKIPKNILQPIIENSLIHGLYNVETGEISGIITVSFKKLDNLLEINIIDNGKGISQDALHNFYNLRNKNNQKERGQHIGLRNILERLQYIYPDFNAFTIKNIDPHGVQVAIQLPINT